MALSFQASGADAGKRLDQCLHERNPEFSRSRIQEWIKQGRATVNGVVQKSSFTLKGNEQVVFDPGSIPALRAFAEDLPIEILYCDEDVVVVNKPAGLVVHAGAGHHSGTLVNALLHHFQTLSSMGGEERPGIVHRLDRETSGVLAVARTDKAHRELAAQFASREVEKIYLALVQGSVKADKGQITAPVSRDPVRRNRMTARLPTGRTALTSYEVLERLPRHTHMRLRIGTGRTHQIRVHMASIGHPVAGDTLYGARQDRYGRFFLHALRLRFMSPSKGEAVEVEAPVPVELQQWLQDARDLL
ncbi:MAG TPA: RluA family pseudouridine synthase [Bryobacteraceae bacterium]|nr:RluA family pseudouridine synthase [Bryobacteraceae bacterium]